MKRSFLFTLLWGVISFAYPATAASLPQWLLGSWIVSDIYEEDPEVVVYPDPEAEPTVWLGGKTMTVEPNRIELGGEICTDISVQERRDTLDHLVKKRLGIESLDQIDLESEPGVQPYLRILCKKPYIQTQQNGLVSRGFPIDWFIIPRDKKTIGLLFLGGAYVELRRPDAPVQK